MASVAAFTPVAYMGAYAASKAYVLHFSEALWAEARDHDVTITACCPGPTRTEFFDVAGVQGWLQKRRALDPETVVRRSLRAMERRKPFAVIGFKEKLQSVAVRLAPRRCACWRAASISAPKHRDVDAKTLPAGSAVDDVAAADAAEIDAAPDPVRKVG